MVVQPSGSPHNMFRAYPDTSRFSPKREVNPDLFAVHENRADAVLPLSDRSCQTPFTHYSHVDTCLWAVELNLKSLTKTKGELVVVLEAYFVDLALFLPWAVGNIVLLSCQLTALFPAIDNISVLCHVYLGPKYQWPQNNHTQNGALNIAERSRHSTNDLPI